MSVARTARRRRKQMMMNNRHLSGMGVSRYRRPGRTIGESIMRERNLAAAAQKRLAKAKKQVSK